MDDGQISLPLVAKEDLNGTKMIPVGAVSYQINLNHNNAKVQTNKVFIENNIKNGGVTTLGLGNDDT